MKKIRRQEMFQCLEEKLGNNYYVGFHGISDQQDIQNAYTDMTKIEKAESIMKIGLINERHISIKSTCKIYGRLSDTYKKDKDYILWMNQFTCYKTEKEHVVIIVAVPVIFQHSDGRTILGGWMNVNIPYNDDDSPVECITDELFREKIPKEMILGYYYFQEGEQTAEFVLNEEYYDNLSQEQKDRFIEALFDKNNLAIDLNKENYVEEIMEKVEDQPNNRGVFFRQNMLEQAEEILKEKDKRDKQEDKKEGYTFEELEKLPLEKIDIDRIIPTYEMVTASKYQIKDILINKCFDEEVNLARDVGYYKIHNMTENEHVDVKAFEEWVKQYHNTPDTLYQAQYQRYYKEIADEFKKHIQEQKEKSMKHGSINLNDKIREYMELGNEIGLFEGCELRDIYSKLQNIEIVEDNAITGDSQAVIINGRNVIKINQKRCAGKSEYFLDEVIFHELTHFANEIHQDLYGDRPHKIMTFKNQYVGLIKDNQLVRYPEWGCILLDEAISQKVAQAMVEKKYGKGMYPIRGVLSPLIGGNFMLMSELADYPEYERLANNFSKTIVGNEGLIGLAKLSMKPKGIDTIFSKYAGKKDGAKNLYEILGYMGNVAIADYASKGHFVLPNSEVNRETSNVLKSMQQALKMIDNVQEQEGPNYGD